MGELHLEIVAERLRREFDLEVRTGQPQVLLRETLTAEAEGEGVFEREIDERADLRAGDGRGSRRCPAVEGFRFRFAPEAEALPFLREETLGWPRRARARRPRPASSRATRCRTSR